MENKEVRKEQNRATATALLEEVAEVVKDAFVATYQTEENALVMQIPNGQKFRIAVAELA